MKVGDNVRVIGVEPFHKKYNVKSGDVGVISAIYSDGDIAVKGDNWNTKGYVFFNGSQLELIDERPERYASREVNGMDVLDLINHWNLNFSEGNILKYLLRDKGEDESDLEKIIDYAQRELKRLRDCK